MTKTRKPILNVLVMLAMVTITTAAFAAEAEHGEAAATPFAGQIYQSAAAVIVFVLTLLILWKFAWGPILGGLQDREQSIKANLDHAAEAAGKAEATLKEYQRKLAEAQEEARHTLERGRADAEKIAADLKAQAENEITQLKARAQSDIQSAKEEALTDIYRQAATLATDVAGRILQREVSADDADRLVSESLSELKKMN